ncbi:hypothetical protein [Methylorubrum zatmanii]
MSEPTDAAGDLRALAQALAIPDYVIADPRFAAFETRHANGAPGLLRAIRFFSCPYSAALVEAYLAVEDAAGRRAMSATCEAIAHSFRPEAERG